MGFYTGIDLINADEGKLGGYYESVAVRCLFTAQGRSIPTAIKYMGASGELVTVEHIRVKQCEKKFYTGILVWQYYCEAMCGDRVKNFILLFYPEDCCWKLKTKQRG